MVDLLLFIFERTFILIVQNIKDTLVRVSFFIAFSLRTVFMIEIFLSIGFLIAGMLLLYFGGDFIVSGSVAIAKRLNISTLVIGLTVVAMGTSMPELFTSVIAMLKGENDITLGNVIGSNIFNVVVVLGISAFFMPLMSPKKSFNRSIIFLFLSYIMLTITVYNTKIFDFNSNTAIINYIEGAILVGFLVFYIIYLYKIMGSDKEELAKLESEVGGQVEEELSNKSMAKPVIKVCLAIAFLAFGSELFIRGAVNIFSRFLSPHIIGVIVVSFGTSIPELVTSVIAAYKKESDISVGNIIGSNIFNVCSVVGISAIVSIFKGGIVIDQASNYYQDFVLMFLSAILLFIFMRNEKPFGKIHGGVFLSLYGIYLFILLFL